MLTLFELPEDHLRLRPLSFTRPVADLRVGILTLGEKWAKRLEVSSHYLTQSYLQAAFPPSEGPVPCVRGNLCPSAALLQAVLHLELGQALWASDGELLAFFPEEAPATIAQILEETEECEKIIFQEEYFQIRYPWDVFQQNRREMEADFALLTEGRASAPITDPHTAVYGHGQIFLEPGVEVKAAILNAENGPIYLGKNAKVEEGSVIRGGNAILEGAVVAPLTRLRGDSTIGPYCKVGGEISNSVLWGYSNKGHDGFLGNSVLGAWCNLGADTNTSNLKNNYGNIKIWGYAQEKAVQTELQFCGLTMGDHSKSGINSMFNTGTVVGVMANVFGGDFPPKFIPSFRWGNAGEFALQKGYEMAERMMQRRNVPFTDYDREVLAHIFAETGKFRG